MAEISAVDEPAQAGALMSIMKARGPGGKEPESPATVKAKEDSMSKTAEELQAELTKSADELAKANARAERMEQLAGLSDAERAHYKSLKGKAQDEFLAKSADERKAEVNDVLAKAKEADPVVYKSATGTEYRKSDDPRLVEMAKRDDEREKDLAKMREEAANANFEKRATTEFAKFKGELDVKTALVKAIAGIKDDTLRSGVEAMLKAAHGAVQLTLKEIGSKKDDYSADDTDGDEKASAEQKLDRLAKARAAEKNEPYIKAYQAVLNSDEGKALYAKSVA